jgi:hypothetical protein
LRPSSIASSLILHNFLPFSMIKSSKMLLHFDFFTAPNLTQRWRVPRSDGRARKDPP